MSKLVNNYIALFESKETASQDLRVNMGVLIHRAREWLNEANQGRQPPKKVLNYMRLCTTQSVVQTHTKTKISNPVAIKIAEDLS